MYLSWKQSVYQYYAYTSIITINTNLSLQRLLCSNYSQQKNNSVKTTKAKTDERLSNTTVTLSPRKFSRGTSVPGTFDETVKQQDYTTTAPLNRKGSDFFRQASVPETSNERRKTSLNDNNNVDHTCSLAKSKCTVSNRMSGAKTQSGLDYPPKREAKSDESLVKAADKTRSRKSVITPFRKTVSAPDDFSISQPDIKTHSIGHDQLSDTSPYSTRRNTSPRLSTLCSSDKKQGGVGSQLKEVRLVMLGSGNVGKTSLIQRLVNGSFPTTYEPTVQETYRHLLELPGE